MDNVTVWAGGLGGAAIGVYLLLQYWLTGKALGVSTGYGSLCALGSNRPFFKQGPYIERWGWRVWFLLGLPLGGALAYLTSPGTEWVLTMEMGTLYESVLPDMLGLRALVLVVGGVCIGFGARMAGGCPSGHSINGLSLQNPPSLWASLGFFAGGIVSVQTLFRVVN